jgi:hypothetical protein
MRRRSGSEEAGFQKSGPDCFSHHRQNTRQAEIFSEIPEQFFKLGQKHGGSEIVRFGQKVSSPVIPLIISSFLYRLDESKIKREAVIMARHPVRGGRRLWKVYRIER